MRWTITSTNGQVLHGDEEPNGDVFMSSKVGNHGQYTRAQWDAALAKMQAAGCKIEITNN